jgi:membrane protease YdiL (CAAX protease family)
MTLILGGVYVNLRWLTTRPEPLWPPLTPSWLPTNPFIGLDALHLAAFVILIEMIVALSANLLLRTEILSEDPITQMTMLLEGIAIPVGAFVFIRFTLKHRNATWQQAFTPVRREAGQIVRFGLHGYLAMLPTTIAFSLAATVVLRQMGLDVQAQPVIELLGDANFPTYLRVSISLMALFTAPIIEELVFRGIALPGLMKHTSTTFAVIAVSAIFALIHFHLPSAPALFVIALACSIAYLKTGNILVPMVMHATFNGTTLASLLFQGLE